jgi:hypothetical protein
VAETLLLPKIIFLVWWHSVWRYVAERLVGLAQNQRIPGKSSNHTRSLYLFMCSQVQLDWYIKSWVVAYLWFMHLYDPFEKHRGIFPFPQFHLWLKTESLGLSGAQPQWYTTVNEQSQKKKFTFCSSVTEPERCGFNWKFWVYIGPTSLLSKCFCTLSRFWYYKTGEKCSFSCFRWNIWFYAKILNSNSVELFRWMLEIFWQGRCS